MCISQAWVLWKLWTSRQTAYWINLSCNRAITKYWPGLFFLKIILRRARSGGGIFSKHLHETLLFIKSPLHMNLTTQPTLQPAENMLQVFEDISRSPGRMAALLKRNANENILRWLLYSPITYCILTPKRRDIADNVAYYTTNIWDQGVLLSAFPTPA